MDKKTKKVTINPINDNDKCFQYSGLVALKDEEIVEKQQRLSKIKTLINKYNWK